MESNVNSQYSKHFGHENDIKFSPNLQKLIDEHTPLLMEIKDIINKVDSFDSDIEKWKEIIIQYHTFVANLERHSEKEERTLFQFMKDHIGTTIGPIEIMEEEHEEISRNLSSFTNYVENEFRDIPSEEDIFELLLYLKQAIDTMEQHFYKEEHAIYPMAEQLLSKEEKDIVGS